LERRKKEHAELAKSLSRNGKQVIAERSGHHVQLEEPEVVVKSVRDVIAAAREKIKACSPRSGDLAKRAGQ
jgi:hypothetical protein